CARFSARFSQLPGWPGRGRRLDATSLTEHGCGSPRTTPVDIHNHALTYIILRKCYRASWQLPGPDLHRQATTSLRTARSPATSLRHLPLRWAHGIDHLGVGTAHQAMGRAHRRCWPAPRWRRKPAAPVPRASAVNDLARPSGRRESGPTRTRQGDAAAAGGRPGAGGPRAPAARPHRPLAAPPSRRRPAVPPGHRDAVHRGNGAQPAGDLVALSLSPEAATG